LTLLDHVSSLPSRKFGELVPIPRLGG
jgi:hypothetical protein